MNAQAQEKIKQLQGMEQSMQQIHMQKQQLQNSVLEFESALKEVENAPEAYKIVGTIMVASSKENIQKDLKQKKEIAEVRLGSLDKQEAQLKEQAQKLQDEVLSTMK